MGAFIRPKITNKNILQNFDKKDSASLRNQAEAYLLVDILWHPQCGQDKRGISEKYRGELF